MQNSLTPNRHTAGAGIHGEWSDNTRDRPIRKLDLVVAAIVLGGMFLAMSVGAAAGF